MQPYTKFGIPSSNNIEKNASNMIILKLGQSQGNSDPKMVCHTRPTQDASTHQIWNSYLKEYRSYVDSRN